MDIDSPKQKSFPISFWLVPSEPDLLKWVTLINHLAKEYGAPPFMPHITLLVTKLEEDESPMLILESATKGVTSFTLEPQGLAHSCIRFKSVFLRFKSDLISHLSTALSSTCRQPGSYQLDAHMTLIYQQLSVMQRIKLISGLQLPQGYLHFDSVVAVMPGSGQSGFDDVEQWRYMAKMGLANGKSEE